METKASTVSHDGNPSAEVKHRRQVDLQCSLASQAGLIGELPASEKPRDKGGTTSEIAF